MPEQGKVKGSAIRPMIEWFAGTCGEAAFDEVLEEISPERRVELSPGSPALGVLPAGWYTEMLASELAEAFLRRAAPLVGEQRAFREIGEAMIDRSLGRIPRAAVEWFASPRTIAASSTMWWRMYHQKGVVYAKLEDETIHATGEGWGEHRLAWCKLIGEACRHVLDLAGCIDAVVTDHVCGGGDGECKMVFRWKGRA
jgi:hypothetical protein